MCQEDQVALLKGGCTEMMILRSAMQYDIDHATWKVNTRVSVAAAAICTSNLFIVMIKGAEQPRGHVFHHSGRTEIGQGKCVRSA